jgi:hypothetical protein
VGERLGRLGIDVRVAAGVAMLVEEHQKSIAWATEFLKTAKPYHLEKEAAGLGRVISMIGERDPELSRTLCDARTYCQHQAEARRALPERMPTGDPFAAPS